jgi:hypothetical protein
METVAVYREHPVLTYRLRAETGFLLLRLVCPLSSLTAMGDALARCQPPLLVSQMGGGLDREEADFFLCLKPDQASILESLLALAGLPPPGPAREVVLIHLQGPHYGDRYGVLAGALAGLAQEDVMPLALATAVHSLYLMIEPTEAARALSGLSQYFTSAEQPDG